MVEGGPARVALGSDPVDLLEGWLGGAAARTSGSRRRRSTAAGARGVPTEMAQKVKALARENRELRQANEILRKASAYFAMAELDRRSKP